MKKEIENEIYLQIFSNYVVYLVFIGACYDCPYNRQTNEIFNYFTFKCILVWLMLDLSGQE